MDKTEVMSIEIENGNKIIAEFDGWKFMENGNCWHERYNDHNQQMEMTPNILSHYHSSWDWLMPVWGKLGKIMYEIRRQISGNDYRQANVFTINILKSFQQADINSAFNWISEAIKWYNELSKQKV